MEILKDFDSGITYYVDGQELPLTYRQELYSLSEYIQQFKRTLKRLEVMGNEILVEIDFDYNRGRVVLTWANKIKFNRRLNYLI